VGCGTGNAAIYLARHGWKVTGIDLVGHALDKGRRKARAASAEVRFVRDDVLHLD
jgi:2-polyprenyl-3-methyl-5-hydroxy-6-metoxy-1,4-benzoquinol methylase